MTSVVREFWLGATRPSLPALFVAVTTAFGTTLGGHLLVKPPTIDRGKPMVVLVGSSSLGRGIPDPVGLRDDLLERTHRTYTVNRLTVPGGHLVEAAATLDGLSPLQDALAILGVSPRTMAYGEVELRQRLEDVEVMSSTLAEELGRAGIPVPRRSGVYFFDHLRLTYARDPIRMVQRLVQRNMPQIGGLRIDAAHHRAWSERVRANFLVNADTNFGVLGRIIGRMQSAGVPLVLVEQPINPMVVRDFLGLEFYQRYLDRLRTFASENGTPLWVVDEAGLGEHDFEDEVHVLMNGEGARRFTRAVGARIAALDSATTTGPK